MPSVFSDGVRRVKIKVADSGVTDQARSDHAWMGALGRLPQLRAGFGSIQHLEQGTELV